MFENQVHEALGDGRTDSYRTEAQRLAELLAYERSRTAGLCGDLRARDEFLAIASHELRNPMAAVVLQLQVIIRRAQGEGVEREWMLQHLSSLQRQCERFFKRASVLLEISRLNTAGIQLELGAVNYSQVTSSVVASLGSEAEAAGVELQTSIGSGVTGECDRLALEQIVSNLVQNGIKYGEHRPVHVMLTRQGNHVVLIVSDHGSGISEQAQRRIFQRFEDSIDAGRLEGFGLGLWIVRQLVLALHGDLSIWSTPEVGSTFTVRLPTG